MARRSPAATAARIARLRRLEDRAQRLRLQLDALENRWETLLAQVQGTPEWQADCAARGFVTDPRWGDVLC